MFEIPIFPQPIPSPPWSKGKNIFKILFIQKYKN